MLAIIFLFILFFYSWCPGITRASYSLDNAGDQTKNLASARHALPLKLSSYHQLANILIMQNMSKFSSYISTAITVFLNKFEVLLICYPSFTYFIYSI